MVFTCCFCEKTDTESFNISKTCTKLSKTCLIDLIHYITESPYLDINQEICQKCLFLLNDLDRMQLRINSIQNIFRGYCEKLIPVENNVEENYDTYGENEIQYVEDKVSVYEAMEYTEIVDEQDTDTDQFDLAVRQEIFSEDNYKIKTEIQEEYQNDMENNSQIKIEIRNLSKIGKPKRVYNYNCKVCSDHFSSQSDFNKHMKDKHNIGHVCNWCGKEFSSSGSLHTHEATLHSNIVFQCNICDKTFTQKGSLAKHYPIHTGEKRFQCEECGKKFIHRSSLTAHILSHTDIKPVQCEICFMRLRNRSHLGRHMKRHTGEKNHVCSACGKMFAENYNLKIHMKMKHGQCQ